jgi:hypothetical protein
VDQPAEVRCNLIHATLPLGDFKDVSTHYTALSYVWGSSQKVETIWIDDRHLKVTASLFSALRDLRDETRAFFLWADGLCIKQEKSLQIQMIDQIYTRATNTIICLGPGDADSKECQFVLSVRQGHEPTDVDALPSIFRNKWFTRVWGFQDFGYLRIPGFSLVELGRSGRRCTTHW